jgi:hypothetical protein
LTLFAALPTLPGMGEPSMPGMPDETELDGDDDEEILDPAGEPDTYPCDSND